MSPISSETPETEQAPLRPIDGHVHIVGNGASGSGCWLRLEGARRLLASWMLHTLGLPRDPSRADFDELYVARLLEMVRASSLGSVVILAQEEAYDPNGLRLDFGSFHVPNRYVFELAARHSEFLPCASIHPARVDALDELDRCLEAGAVMLKLLPNCLGVDYSDPRYTSFWEKMASAGLPLLSHTGGETTVPVIDPALADPRRLARPLEIGVSVIAAHAATRSGLFDPDWFPALAEMMRRFPRLYADNSAFNLPMRGEWTRAAAFGPMSERMIYGSDLPVPVSGFWAWARGFISWGTYRHWERHPNPLERDYQLKRACGFSDASFTRLHHILRRPVGISGHSSSGVPASA